jgi:hypothetical protein
MLDSVRLVLTIVACVAMAATFIRSEATVGATNQPRDQTIRKVRPFSQLFILRPKKEPTVVHPVTPEPKVEGPNAKPETRPAEGQQPGPFHLPVFVPDVGSENERTAHRQPGASTSD